MIDAHPSSCLAEDGCLCKTQDKILRVSSPAISWAAVAGAQFAEGDQLQVEFILQLPRLLPQICKHTHTVRASDPSNIIHTGAEGPNSAERYIKTKGAVSISHHLMCVAADTTGSQCIWVINPLVQRRSF